MLNFVSKRSGGGEEHFVGYETACAGNDTEADTREYVGIIPLAGDELLAIEGNGIEWAAAGKYSAAAGAAVGFLGGAFGHGGGIGEGEDDGALNNGGDLLEDFAREGSVLAGDANQGCGAKVFDDLDGIGEELVIVGEGEFVAGEIVAAFDDEALGIDEPAALPGLGFGEALGHESGDNQFADSGASFAGAEEEEFLLAEGHTGDAQGGVDAGEGDGGGALDVIIEGADAGAVFREEAESVVIGEILKLEEGVWEYGGDRGDEFFDEFIISRAGEAALAEAEVKRIVEQRLVVRADINGDREALVGIDARACGVESEFADRDAHAIRAEVAEAEDALAVGDDDDADIGPGPIPEQLDDAAAVIGGNEETARAPEDMAVKLACLADGGGVDQRHHLVDVILDDTIEESLVAVLKGEEKDVPLEGVRLFADVFQDAADLIVLVLDARGEKAAEAKGVAFGLGKGGAFVKGGIVEDADPAGQCGEIGVHGSKFGERVGIIRSLSGTNIADTSPWEPIILCGRVDRNWPIRFSQMLDDEKQSKAGKKWKVR